MIADDRPRREISGSCCPVQTSSKFKLVRFIRQKSFPMFPYRVSRSDIAEKVKKNLAPNLFTDPHCPIHRMEVFI